MEVQHVAGGVDGQQEVARLAFASLAVGRGIDPRLAGLRHVAAEHFRSTAIPLARPQPQCAFDRQHLPRRKELAQRHGQAVGNRQHVLPPAFGDGRFDHKERLPGFKIETRRREAGDFVRPQAGVRGDLIDRRAIDGRQRLAIVAGGLRRRHEPFQLVALHRASAKPHVLLLVELGDARERVARQAVIVVGPAAKRLRGGEVVIRRAQPDRPRPVAGQARQRVDGAAIEMQLEPVADRLRCNVADESKAAAVQQLDQTAERACDVAAGDALRFQEAAEVVDVIREWPAARRFERVGLGVAGELRLALQVGEHFLAGPLRFTQLVPPHDAVGVGRLAVEMLREFDLTRAAIAELDPKHGHRLHLSCTPATQTAGARPRPT